MLYRALPLVVGLVVLAAVAYLVLSAWRSPERARSVLIRAFTGITGFLTVFFCVATAYAWLEDNLYVLEFTGALAMASALGFVVTRLFHRRYIRRHGTGSNRS